MKIERYLVESNAKFPSRDHWAILVFQTSTSHEYNEEVVESHYYAFLDKKVWLNAVAEVARRESESQHHSIKTTFSAFPASGKKMVVTSFSVTVKD